MTISTPVSPRARRLWRNSVQKTLSSEIPNGEPEDLSVSLLGHRMATTTARETTRLFTRPLGVGGVQEDGGVGGVTE